MGKTAKTPQNINVVSDLKKENALLKQRLEIFENIIALTPGHVYWKDHNSIYLGCNDEMARVVGLKSRHDIVGKTDHDLPWKEKASVLINNDKEVIRPVAQAHSATGGIAVLFGNLAPEGAVVKKAAVAPEMMTHRGKARVFDSEEEATKAIMNKQITTVMIDMKTSMTM